jgi:predicted O-methyltransferase YrrM
MSDSTLHLVYPQFVPTAENLAEATARLEPAYQDYIKHVSPSQMTIALETSAYLLWAMEQLPQVRSAVDFGSGFTSYVLRLACADVWSVDDSPEWLCWTRRFLERHGKDCGQLAVWDDYKHTEHSHDVVVYDFSSGQMRDDYFQFAIGQLSPGGIAILDDANHQGHQKSMYKAARHYRYGLFGLQDWTRDFHRRFAALVVAP